jgi:hypothetical protein
MHRIEARHNGIEGVSALKRFHPDLFALDDSANSGKDVPGCRQNAWCYLKASPSRAATIQDPSQVPVGPPHI